MTTNTYEAYGADWINSVRTQLEAEHATQTARLAELTAAPSDSEWASLEGHNQSAMLASTRQSLEDLTEALRRIVEGRYGVCDKCEASIPRERLEILPHARTCVPCQQRHNR